MNEIQFNTIYRFNFPITIGTLSADVVAKLGKDGRFLSHALEYQLADWFPLIRVDQTHYDLVDKATQTIKYEAKCFTNNGAKLLPSKMQGSKREVDYPAFMDIALNTIYIVLDITAFPEIRVVFIEGQEVLKRFSNAKITPSQGRLLFKGL